MFCYKCETIYMKRNPILYLVGWIRNENKIRCLRWDSRIAQQLFFFTNLRCNLLYFSYFLGKGGLGSTKFVAFETLAWHNECFFCNICKDSMVGKGFIQVVIENLGSPRMSFASCIFVYNLYTYLYTYTHYTAWKRCSPLQDGENIICPECARKKMMEEIEAEWGEIFI